MEFDNHFFFRLRQHRRTFIIAYAAAMLIVFPYIPPQIAALGNLGLVVLANLLGFWRWGLALRPGCGGRGRRSSARIPWARW